MKKILIGYITKNLGAGINQYIINFAKKISSEDIQIDFLTREDIECKNDIEKNILSDIKYNNLIFIPRNKNFFSCIKELKKIIKKEKYDITYFNISSAHDCLGALAAKQCGVKKIISHSHNSSANGNTIISRVIKTIINSVGKLFLVNYANTYLTCSEKAAKWLYPTYINNDPNNYTFVYNTVDSNKFKYDSKKRTEIRKKLGLNNEMLIGHIARFNLNQKNNYFTIDILEELLKKDKNVKLICIGGGEDFNKVYNYAQKKNLLEHIIFTGRINNVEDYMHAIDVFILPSRFEGLPITGIEAQFAGIPCLFSDKITKDVIIGKNSKMLPIKFSKVWANEILKLKDNRENELLEAANNFDESKSIQPRKIIDDNTFQYKKEMNTCLLVNVLKGLLICHYICNLSSYLNGFNYLLSIVGILMIIIVLMNINKLKCLYGNKIYILCIMFLLSYVGSFTLNTMFEVKTTIKVFIWLTLNMFFSSLFMFYKTDKKVKTDFKFLMTIYVFAIGVFNVINFYQLITFKSGIIKSFDGQKIISGLSSWGRFYGVFYDPNYSSVVSTIAFISGLYLIKKYKNKLLKFLIGVLNMIGFIYICFCQSRTGLVTFTFGIFIYMTMLLVINNNKRIIKILVALLLSLCIFFSPKILLPSYNSFKNYILNRKIEIIKTKPSKNSTKESIKKQEEEIVKEMKNVGREDNSSDITNRRLDIWKSGLELFQENPIYGLGYGNVEEYSKKYLPNTYIVNNNYAVFRVFHNFIIDVAVNQGLIGLSITLITIIYLILKLIKSRIIFDKDNHYEISVIISSLAVIFISGMVLSQIFYVNNAVTFTFWFLLGFLCYYLRRCKYEK